MFDPQGYINCPFWEHSYLRYSYLNFRSWELQIRPRHKGNMRVIAHPGNLIIIPCGRWSNNAFKVKQPSAILEWHSDELWSRFMNNNNPPSGERGSICRLFNIRSIGLVYASLYCNSLFVLCTGRSSNIAYQQVKVYTVGFWSRD